MLEGPCPPLLAPIRTPAAFASEPRPLELQDILHRKRTGDRIAIEAPAAMDGLGLAPLRLRLDEQGAQA